MRTSSMAPVLVRPECCEPALCARGRGPAQQDPTYALNRCAVEEAAGSGHLTAGGFVFQLLHSHADELAPPAAQLAQVKILYRVVRGGEAERPARAREGSGSHGVEELVFPRQVAPDGFEPDIQELHGVPALHGIDVRSHAIGGLKSL